MSDFVFSWDDDLTDGYLEDVKEIYVGQIGKYDKDTDSYKFYDSSDCESIYNWAVGNDTDDELYTSFGFIEETNQLVKYPLITEEENDIEGEITGDNTDINRKINLTKLVKGSNTFGSAKDFNRGRANPSILNPMFIPTSHGLGSLLFKDISLEETRKRLNSIFPSSKHDFINSHSGHELFKALVTFDMFEGLKRCEFLEIMLKLNHKIGIDDSCVPEIITKDVINIICRNGNGFGYSMDEDGGYYCDGDESIEKIIPYFFKLKEPGIYLFGLDTLSEVQLAAGFSSYNDYSLKDIEKFEIYTGFKDQLLDDDMFPSEFSDYGFSISDGLTWYFDITDISAKDHKGLETSAHLSFENWRVNDRKFIVFKITPNYEIYPLRAYCDDWSYDTEGDTWFDYDEKIIEKCKYFSEDPNNEKPSSTKSLTKAQSIAIGFWTRLNERISEKRSRLPTRKYNTDPWYHFAVGSSKSCVRIALASREKCVSTDFWIFDNRQLFDELAKNKKEIERKLKFSLDWDRKDGYKAASISLRIYDVDLEDRQSWDSLIDDLIVKCELLQKVFKEYLE